MIQRTWSPVDPRGDLGNWRLLIPTPRPRPRPPCPCIFCPPVPWWQLFSRTQPWDRYVWLRPSGSYSWLNTGLYRNLKLLAGRCDGLSRSTHDQPGVSVPGLFSLHLPSWSGLFPAICVWEPVCKPPAVGWSHYFPKGPLDLYSYFLGCLLLSVSFPTCVSWNYIPNKLIVLEYIFQGQFIWNPPQRQNFS